ncbi:CBFD_NFYB_HMF domain-containing protein [Cephalotus follicularis]|uniref:CBFD_NFYB_HMF domain-containing protein n=1 Tax=Cephalotus follicularis TaxID=3775 RepID=A0A1Q3B6P4_CEPFO|nr:CBFD_NFYB_HMF domain-containing protein [Cephalotus follicularis]
MWENDTGIQNNSYANSETSAREQERLLPIANVRRIMKKALPANAKIPKDAIETVQECVYVEPYKIYLQKLREAEGEKIAMGEQSDGGGLVNSGNSGVGFPAGGSGFLLFYLKKI